MAVPSPPTQTVRGNTVYVRRFQVDVIDGPDRGATTASTSDEVTIGTADGVDLRLTDPAVSRHHCALRATERGLELRDLGSTNGTFAGDAEIVRGFVRTGARIRIGTTTLGVALRGDEIAQPLASDDRFGEVLGASPAMRRLYPVLERCAHSDITVLLQGETGTGKELVAEAIHRASARRDGPFVVVDCGALPRQLTESELFGHVRGAFTGADADRAGAFETASGGTIFLDEIGELALELQPLLLRTLENRTIRRVGANQHREIDVRVIAASHRDLRIEVNARRFRADLFYRLHVMRIVLPGLVDRAEDIPLLAEHFWRTFRPDRAIPAEVVSELARQRWPGNVRELRNAVERIALFGREPGDADPVLSYGQAKDRASREWEQRWIRDLLHASDHNVSRAARTGQMSRSHLRELVQRYGLSRGTTDDHDDDA
jgi:transcriptional regulator with GAF, ATPase, and Fis domain